MEMNCWSYKNKGNLPAAETTDRVDGRSESSKGYGNDGSLQDNMVVVSHDSFNSVGRLTKEAIIVDCE